MNMSKQQFFLAVLITSLLLVDLLVLAFIRIPPDNKDTFNLFLGAQLGVVATVVAFAFPSNVSSAGKDHTIATLAAKTSPVETTTTETVTRTTEASVKEGNEDGRARPV